MGLDEKDPLAEKPRYDWPGVGPGGHVHVFVPISEHRGRCACGLESLEVGELHDGPPILGPFENTPPRPTYNHSRGDSAITPCGFCRAVADAPSNDVAHLLLALDASSDVCDKSPMKARSPVLHAIGLIARQYLRSLKQAR